MKKYNIQKRERIKLQADIKNTFNRGKQYSDKYLKIFVLQNGKTYTRFAVVINKKFGKAVFRNRAKRHVRELFRLNKGKLKTGYNIIIFIKNEFNNTVFSEKMDNYLTLLKKSKLLKGISNK